MKTLEDLLALEATHDLIARYARYVDAGDMAACAGLFAPDAEVLVMGKTRKGPGEILVWLEAMGQMSAGRSGKHFVSNTVVTLEGTDRVSATSDMMFVGALGGGAWSIVAVGSYNDAFVRQGEHWRFARREIVFLANVPGSAAA